ncbi:hypothetical protein EHS25_006414 [Saitozyma podzolica]|uniref:Uncharacterized protein n=1 Tax=Saitozyma podzolica TaxID=1890683 RepID=A0A427YRW7_9TREE|nr:hypothetical protein EHS25_006414 [Saitozyma podzolica]
MSDAVGSSVGVYEIEEEFDPALLGFPSTSKPAATWPSTSTGNERNTWVPTERHGSPAGPLPDIRSEAGDENLGEATIRHERGAMGHLSRSATQRRPPTGRYSSADWLPSVHLPERSSIPTPAGQAVDVVDVQTRSSAETTEEGAAAQATGVQVESLHPALHGFLRNGDDEPDGHSAASAEPSTVSLTPSTASDLGPEPRRDFRYRKVRLPGRKGYRLTIKPKYGPRPPEERAKLDMVANQVQQALDGAAALRLDETPEPPPPPLPLDSIFQRDLVAAFGADRLDKLNRLSMLHNTSGDALPSHVRDLFPALADPLSSISLANDIRTHLDLPHLSLSTDKVALRRAIATMREKLYVEIAAALVLPLAPPAQEEPQIDEDDLPLKEDMSLTPMSLDHMEKALPKRFPADKAAIRAFLAKVPNNIGAAYGEPGAVVWERGVGRMAEEPKYEWWRRGYHGVVNTDGPVHVFVDHSNVLHGLLHHLYNSPSTSLPPRHLRILSLPCLSLLLRRGRPTPPGSLHLVASSPLKQDLDPAVQLGWEVSVLKRVEVYEDEVLDPLSMDLKPRAQAHPQTGVGFGSGGGFDRHGTRRYREQGVDEILHLKILQTLNTKSDPAPKGSTIVLATGDARGGQFNRDGFLGAVREALRRGWAVELWSWKAGLSRAWAETAKRERWDRKFGIHLLNEWAEQLVEVENLGLDLQ